VRINNVKMYETAVLAIAKQQVFLTVYSKNEHESLTEGINNVKIYEIAVLAMAKQHLFITVHGDREESLTYVVALLAMAKKQLLQFVKFFYLKINFKVLK
jgi:hypothetical protein